jgi:hypothetical protein
MGKGLRYREHAVSCMLSDDEYIELRRLCAALGLPVWHILLFGMRRAARILAKEQRKSQ